MMNVNLFYNLLAIAVLLKVSSVLMGIYIRAPAHEHNICRICFFSEVLSEIVCVFRRYLVYHVFAYYIKDGIERIAYIEDVNESRPSTYTHTNVDGRLW